MKKNRKVTKQGHAARFQLGEVVVAAARDIDTAPVDELLAAFVRQHSAYKQAHADVDVSRVQLEAGGDAVAAQHEAQDDALERLVAALIWDDHSRTAPLKAYTDATPTNLKHLSFVDKHEVMTKLAEDVLADPKANEATLTTARALREAAQAMPDVLQSLADLEVASDAARVARDIAAERWDKALAALKSGARHAAHQERPDLYDSLFKVATSRSTRRRSKRNDSSADNDRSSREAA